MKAAPATSWMARCGLASARGRPLISLLLSLLAATASAAEPPTPDGIRSSLECTASVRERDLMACTLKIEPGPADRVDTPAGTDWTVTLPPQALFADADAGASFDAERRVLQGRALGAPGAVSTVRFRLIVAPDTLGSRQTVRASIATAQPTYLSATAEIEARWHPDDAGQGGTPGALRLTTAGLWVFGYLLTGPLFIGACAWLGGRRLGVLGPAIATWAGAGFVLVFAAMAREDARLWFDYREAACVVTDTGQHTRTSGQGRHAANISEPFVAVRFDLAGQGVHGVGFDSGSHLRVGGSSWPPAELQAFGPGAAVRCWYDPQDPARMIVVRGPGGAYLFALLPLGLLWLVVPFLWRAVTERR